MGIPGDTGHFAGYGGCGWLVGWLVGWFVRSLVGWFVGCFEKFQVK